MSTTAANNVTFTVTAADGDASPFAVLCAIEGERLPFFLDSGMDPNRLGRFSFVGCEPFRVVHSAGKGVWIDGKRAGQNGMAGETLRLSANEIVDTVAP